MTAAAVLEQICAEVHRRFYAGRGPRLWMSQRHHVERAVLLYGQECNQRGWEVDAEFIVADLVGLLNQLAAQGFDAEAAFFPSYLAGAVRKRLGLRAEEMRAAALKADGDRVRAASARVVQGLRVTPEIPRASVVETMALHYQELERQRRARKARAKAPAAQAKELRLL